MTSYRIRATGAYPATDADMRRANPAVSLPAMIDAATAAAFGFDAVTPAARPPLSGSQMAVEGVPAQQPDGSWAQTWIVVAGPPLLDLADTTFGGADPWQTLAAI